jgi:hypothetical protein
MIILSLSLGKVFLHGSLSGKKIKIKGEREKRRFIATRPHSIRDLIVNFSFFPRLCAHA